MSLHTPLQQGMIYDRRSFYEPGDRADRRSVRRACFHPVRSKEKGSPAAPGGILRKPRIPDGGNPGAASTGGGRPWRRMAAFHRGKSSEPGTQSGSADTAALGVAGADGMRVPPLNEALRRRFALIAADTPELARAGDGLPPALAGWPEDWPLRASVGTAAIRITVPGKRMDQPRDLDRIIGPGEQCIQCRASLLHNDGYEQ
jgi:hypothetical protein